MPPRFLYLYKRYLFCKLFILDDALFENNGIFLLWSIARHIGSELFCSHIWLFLGLQRSQYVCDYQRKHSVFSLLCHRINSLAVRKTRRHRKSHCSNLGQALEMSATRVEVFTCSVWSWIGTEYMYIAKCLYQIQKTMGWIEDPSKMNYSLVIHQLSHCS